MQLCGWSVIVDEPRRAGCMRMCRSPIVERGVSTNLLSSGYARLIRVIDEFAKHICTSIYAGYARRWSGNWTGCRITTSAVP